MFQGITFNVGSKPGIYVDLHEDLSVQPFQPEMNLESDVVESSA